MRCFEYAFIKNQFLKKIDISKCREHKMLSKIISNRNDFVYKLNLKGNFLEVL